MAFGGTKMPNYVSVEDFDPSVPDKSAKLWFVYTGHNHLKPYRSRGPAMQLFRKCSQAKLFEWDPTACAWKLLAAKLPHDPFCDLCGGTTVDYPMTWAYGVGGMVPDTSRPKTDQGEHVFLRKSRKLVDPLQLVYACYPCREGRDLY